MPQLKLKPLSSSMCFSKRSQNCNKQFKQTKEIIRMQMINQSKAKRLMESKMKEGNPMETFDTDSDIMKGVTELICYTPLKKMLNSKPISRTRESIGSYLTKNAPNKRLDLYYSTTTSTKYFHKASQFSLMSADQEIDIENKKVTKSERQLAHQRNELSSSAMLYSQRQSNINEDNQMIMDKEMRLSILDLKNGNDKDHKEILNKTKLNTYSNFPSSLSSPHSEFQKQYEPNNLYCSQVEFANRHSLNIRKKISNRYFDSNDFIKDDNLNEINSYSNSNLLRNKQNNEKNILLIQSYLRGYWLRVNMNSMQKRPPLLLHSIHQNINRTELIGNQRFEQISHLNDKIVLLDEDKQEKKTYNLKKTIIRNRTNANINNNEKDNIKQFDPKITNSKLPMQKNDETKGKATIDHDDIELSNQLKEIIKSKKDLKHYVNHETQCDILNKDCQNDILRIEEDNSNDKELLIAKNTYQNKSNDINYTNSFSQQTIQMSSINTLLIPASYGKVTNEKSLSEKDIERNDGSSIKIKVSSPKEYNLNSFCFDVIDKNEKDDFVTKNKQLLLKSKKKIELHQQEDVKQDQSPESNLSSFKATNNSKDILKPPTELSKSKNDFIVSNKQDVFIPHQIKHSIKEIQILESIIIRSPSQTSSNNFSIAEDNRKTRKFDLHSLEIEKMVVITENKAFNLSCPKTEHNLREKLKDKEVKLTMQNVNNITINPICNCPSDNITLKPEVIEIYTDKKNSKLIIEKINTTEFNIIAKQKLKNQNRLLIRKQIQFKYDIEKQISQKQFDISKITEECFTMTFQNTSIEESTEKKIKDTHSISIISPIQEHSFNILTLSSVNSTNNQSKLKSKSKSYSNQSKNTEDKQIKRTSLSNYIIESNHIEISSFDISLIKIKEAQYSQIKQNTVESFCLPTQSNIALPRLHRSYQSSPNVLSFLELPIKPSKSLNQTQSNKRSFLLINQSMTNPFNRYINIKSEIDNINLTEQSEDNLTIPQLMNKEYATGWIDTIGVTHFELQITSIANVTDSNFTDNKQYSFRNNKQADVINKIKIASIDNRFQVNCFDMNIKAVYDYNEVKKKVINEYQMNKNSMLEYQSKEQFEIRKLSKGNLSERMLMQSFLLLKLKTTIMKILYEYGFNHLMQKLKESKALFKKQSVISIRRDNDDKLVKKVLNKWKMNLIALRVIEKIRLDKVQEIYLNTPNTNYSFEIIKQRKESLLFKVNHCFELLKIRLDKDKENYLNIPDTNYSFEIIKQREKSLLFKVNQSFELLNRKSDRLVFQTELGNCIEILSKPKLKIELSKSLENNIAIISKSKEAISNQCSIQNRFTIETKVNEQNSYFSKFNIQIEQINENSFCINRLEDFNINYSIVTESDFLYEPKLLSNTNNDLPCSDKRKVCNDALLVIISPNQFELLNENNNNNNNNSTFVFKQTKRDKLELIDNIFKYKTELSKSSLFHRWHYHTKRKEKINFQIEKYQLITTPKNKDTPISADLAINQMKKGFSLGKLQLLYYRRLMQISLSKWKTFKIRTEKKKQTLRVSRNANLSNSDINEQIKKIIKSNFNKANKQLLSGSILSKCITNNNIRNTKAYLLHYVTKWSIASRKLLLLKIKQYTLEQSIEKHLMIKRAFCQYIRNSQFVQKEQALSTLIQNNIKKNNYRLVYNSYCKWITKVNRQKVLLKRIDIIEQRSFSIKDRFQLWRNAKRLFASNKMIILYENKLKKEGDYNNSNSILSNYYFRWKTCYIPLLHNSIVYVSSTTNYNTIQFSVIKQKLSSIKNKQKRKIYKIKTKMTLFKKLTKKLIQNDSFYRLRHYFCQWKEIVTKYTLNIKRITIVDNQLSSSSMIKKIRNIVTNKTRISQTFKASFTKWKNIRERDNKDNRDEKEKGVIINIKRSKIQIPKEKKIITTLQYNEAERIFMSLKSKVIIRRVLKKWKATM